MTNKQREREKARKRHNDTNFHLGGKQKQILPEIDSDNWFLGDGDPITLRGDSSLSPLGGERKLEGRMRSPVHKVCIWEKSSCGRSTWTGDPTIDFKRSNHPWKYRLLQNVLHLAIRRTLLETLFWCVPWLRGPKFRESLATDAPRRSSVPASALFIGLKRSSPPKTPITRTRDEFAFPACLLC